MKWRSLPGKQVRKGHFGYWEQQEQRKGATRECDVLRELYAVQDGSNIRYV